MKSRVTKSNTKRNKSKIKDQNLTITPELKWLESRILKNIRWNLKSDKLLSPVGFLFVISIEDLNFFTQILEEHASDWQKAEYLSSSKELIYFQGANGPVWIWRSKSKEEVHAGSFLMESEFYAAKELAGSLVPHFKANLLKSIEIHFSGLSDATIEGFLLGLEVGSYYFKEAGLKSKDMILSVQLTNCTWDLKKLDDIIAKARAINSCRNLVNLPGNFVNPKSLAYFIKGLKWNKNTQIQIWDEKKLVKEEMNLILAVGQGSPTPATMVHIKYRPKSKSEPIAFVGKGVTFDTGGLDIKPSSAMRLMKKDMAGAAALLGLAWWMSETNQDVPCDFYLCFAENTVDGNSMRPGDLIRSKAGHLIEIDNTDAEGRLVMADGLSVAISQNEKPQIVIDLSTLTGAIKVALGAEVGGLFSNDNILAEKLYEAGRHSGDYLWRMPLVQKYFTSLSSQFGDFKNSGEGFGGAITAALFLEKFVSKVKWAHLDVYGWNDKASGSCSHPGANAQGLLCLMSFIENI